MGGGSTAAAAQNTHTLSGQPGQLPGKIVRLALILHLGAGDHRIARVGHDRQRQLFCPAAAPAYAWHREQKRSSGPRHPLHRRRSCCAPAPAVPTLAGVAVRQHRKGHQHKGIRHRLLDLFRRLRPHRRRCSASQTKSSLPPMRQTAAPRPYTPGPPAGPRCPGRGQDRQTRRRRSLPLPLRPASSLRRPVASHSGS